MGDELETPIALDALTEACNILNAEWTRFEIILKKLPKIASKINLLEYQKIFTQKLDIETISSGIRAIWELEETVKSIFPWFQPFRLKSIPVHEKNLLRIIEQITKRIRALKHYLRKKLPLITRVREIPFINENFTEITQILIIIVGMSITLIGISFLILSILPGLIPGFKLEFRYNSLADLSYVLIFLAVILFLTGEFFIIKLQTTSEAKSWLSSFFITASAMMADIAAIGLAQEVTNTGIRFGAFLFTREIIVLIFLTIAVLMASIGFYQDQSVLNGAALSIFSQFTLFLIGISPLSFDINILTAFVFVLYLWIWILAIWSENPIVRFSLLGLNVLLFSPLVGAANEFILGGIACIGPGLYYFSSRTTVAKAQKDIHSTVITTDWRIMEWSFGLTAITLFAILWLVDNDVISPEFAVITSFIVLIQVLVIITFNKSLIRGGLVALSVSALAWGPYAWFLSLKQVWVYSLIPVALVMGTLLCFWLSAQLGELSIIDLILNEWSIALILVFIAITIGPFEPIVYAALLLLAPLCIYFGRSFPFLKEFETAWLTWVAPFFAILIGIFARPFSSNIVLFNMLSVVLLTGSFFVVLTYAYETNQKLVLLKFGWYIVTIALFGIFFVLIALIPQYWFYYLVSLGLILILEFIMVIINRNCLSNSIILCFDLLLPLFGLIIYVGSLTTEWIIIVWSIIIITTTWVYKFDNPVPTVSNEQLETSSKPINIKQPLHDIHFVILVLLSFLILLRNPDWIVQTVVLLSIPLIEFFSMIIDRNSEISTTIGIETSMIGVFLLHTFIFLGVNDNLYYSPLNEILPILQNILAFTGITYDFLQWPLAVLYPAFLLILTWIIFFLITMFDSPKALRLGLINEHWISISAVILFLGLGIFQGVFHPWLAGFLLFVILCISIPLTYSQVNSILPLDWLILGGLSFIGLLTAFFNTSNSTEKDLLHLILIFGLGIIFVILLMVVNRSLQDEKLVTTNQSFIIVVGELMGLIITLTIIEFLTFSSADVLVSAFSFIAFISGMIFIIVEYFQMSENYQLSEDSTGINALISSIPIWTASVFSLAFVIMANYSFQPYFSMITGITVIYITFVNIAIIIIHSRIIKGKTTSMIQLGIITIDISSILIVSSLIIPTLFFIEYEAFGLMMSVLTTILVTMAIIKNHRKPIDDNTDDNWSIMISVSSIPVFFVAQAIFLTPSLYTTWWWLFGVGLVILHLQSNRDVMNSPYLASAVIVLTGGVIKLIYETWQMFQSQTFDIFVSFNLILGGLLILSAGYQLIAKTPTRKNTN